MANDHGSWNDGIIAEFRANNGTVTHFGRALVLVHHIGAKSGEERVAPVMGIRVDADTWLIAASKGGAPTHPSWYHNLVAHPDTVIETPDDAIVPVHAVALRGKERDAAWARFTAASSGFADYEKKTTRTIPVVQLRRRDPATD